MGSLVLTSTYSSTVRMVPTKWQRMLMLMAAGKKIETPMKRQTYSMTKHAIAP
jgi:hypothetical protein